MKNITCIVLIVFIELSADAQEFPNLDLSDICCTANEFVGDPFTDPFCCALPWGVSHGTPQMITSSSSILVCAGEGLCDIDTPSGQCGGSEGVIYEYFFKKGHKYQFQADLGLFNSSPSLSRVRIALVNGVDPITTPAPSQRSYNVPSYEDRQTIWTMENFATSQSIDVTFIPDIDYTDLWIYAWSDEEPVETPPGSGDFRHNCLTVDNLSFTCCKENITIGTTERIIYPGWTQSVHNPLPPYNHVSGTITFDLSSGDININSGEVVSLKAGQAIEIMANNSGSSINVDVENGAELHMMIEDCLCSSEGNDICNNYIPPGQNNIGGFEHIHLPNIFSPNGSGPGEETRYFTVTYSYLGGVYIMPYNAHRAEFRIFLRSDLFHEQIIDDECNGIPEGSLFWDGCTVDIFGNPWPAPSAVYTWKLYLKNCHTDIELYGTVQLAGASNDCTSNFVPNQNSSDATFFVGVNNQASYLKDTTALPELGVFPNPFTTEDVNIVYSLATNEEVDLCIQDINGKIVRVIESNKYVEKGVWKMNLNLSSLEKGVYLLNFRSKRFNILKKIVKI